jgi:crotonobetainyl-CoA:carnitine CoA-transferase CaiB-like acyl-CoA transferase
MKPLDDVTILDLSRVLACPFASMLLAELGARVLKVEQPGAGDETRGFEPQLARDSAYYFACNRSKQSITVNLRSEEGRRIVRELAQRADVFVENFPVGTLARHGLDYATLSSLHPRLVYVSCTGFGQSGPYAKKKGYDTVFQAMGGLMSLTGERGGPPVKPGLPVADLTSGLWVAIAILATLHGRTRTDRGCHVDFSMLDGQVALLTLAAARYFALGEVPPRLGTEHPGRVPSATFRCRDGRFAHITASDQHWKPMCDALGLSKLGSDPDFSDNAKRVARRKEVMAALTGAVGKLDRPQLLAALDAAEVPVGPVNDVAEILADPHVRARGLVGSFDYPGVGEFRALGLPYRFLGWDNPEIGRPPTLGEHTAQVLAELLGMPADEIARLKEAKAI